MSLVSFAIDDRNFVTTPLPLPANLLSRFIYSSYEKKAPLFNSGSSLKQTEKKHGENIQGVVERAGPA